MLDQSKFLLFSWSAIPAVVDSPLHSYLHCCIAVTVLISLYQVFEPLENMIHTTQKGDVLLESYLIVRVVLVCQLLSCILLIYAHVIALILGKNSFYWHLPINYERLNYMCIFSLFIQRIKKLGNCQNRVLCSNWGVFSTVLKD